MSFERAYEALIHNEGGYSDDPHDNGGKTKYGISQARYPMINIKALTLDQAKEITKRDYWDKFRCGELPWPIAMVFFDCVFNHNPVNPIKWLQTAVGAKADGILGPATIAAASRVEDPILVARDMLAMRQLYFTELEDWRRYSRGWTKRILDTMLAAALGAPE